MTRMIASAFAALALAGMAAPGALAEPKTHSLTVSYADLDLSSPAGAKTMLNRLQRASLRVCGSATLRTPEEQVWAKACVTDAMAGAVSRLNAPMVTALFMDPKRSQMASR